MQKARSILLVIMIILSATACASGSYYRGEDRSEKANEARIEKEVYGIEQYQKGYEDGLDYALYYYHQEALEYEDRAYAEELGSFQTAIAELMYDHEYDVVAKIAEYYPEGVETALEIEFGVKDIATVIDYLNILSETVSGSCEICGQSVYADEFVLLPDGIECAHSKCISDNNADKSYQIKK